MPFRELFPLMYLAYLVAGTVCVFAVSGVLIWLCLAQGRRGPSARSLRGQEFVWTLVPVLVLVGLTVLGEIPRGWARIAAGARGAAIHARLAQ
jgi:heme/copper-type cytochrome/quinol oxidase subunit 2